MSHNLNNDQDEINAREELQYVAQPKSVPPTLYRERSTITSQPRPGDTNTINDNIPINRIPIPAMQYGLNSPTPFIPQTGLDFLQGLASVHIQQTFELNDMLSTVSSENRFTVRSPLNQAIYAASESSVAKDRMLFGSSRPFTMHLLDRTYQEALTLHRRISCSVFCFSCQPQFIEVWVPPGDLIGLVRERFSITNEFIVENSDREILYRIVGENQFSCCYPAETHFRILSGDALTQKGNISRTWNSDISTYTINIYFVNSEMDVKQKALLLAAGFLFEYKFFQKRKCC